MPETIRCVIIEDELIHQIALQKLIDKVPNLQLSGIYDSPEEALSVVDREEIDLAFVDIILPHGNGMDLATKLREEGCEVIMTTSLDNFAIRAYEIDAVDYILKPIEQDRFLHATKKALQRIELKADPLGEDPEGIGHLNPKSIFYVKKEGDYIHVMHLGGKTTLKMTLKYFMERIQDERFLRIHKSYLVNLDVIKKVQKDKVYLEDVILPLSRLGKSSLMEKMRIWS